MFLCLSLKVGEGGWYSAVMLIQCVSVSVNVGEGGGGIVQ